MLWPWFAVAFVTISGRIFWLRKGKLLWSFLSQELFPGKNLHPVVLFKIVLSFYQILLLQPDIYDFEFPQMYLDWLSRFSLVTLNLPSYVSIDCLVKNNYHSKMHGVSFFAGLMMAVIGLQLLWPEVHKAALLLRLRFARQSENGAGNNSDVKSTLAVPEKEQTVSKHFSACLVVSYLIYPSFTAVFSQTFNCRTIDGVSYLTKDLSIRCDSPEQHAAEILAGFMLVLFSTGLPALYLAMLVKHRPAANAAGGREHTVDSGGMYSTMAFFHRDYSEDYYAWEVVELARKLTLTAVTVQFQKGSMVQVVLACAVIILHVIALAAYKPFKRFEHTLLAIFTYAQMLFVFLGGLTLKVKVEVSNASIFGRGISGPAITAGLVFALVSVLLLAVAMMLDDLQRAARAPVMRHARTHSRVKEPVSFRTYAADDRFHLFLSHVWSTGQDQVLSIKKELTLLVPSIRIFLDIENLTDIGSLERNIEGSDMMLMFLSRGYFGSWNCLREVRHALMLHLHANRGGGGDGAAPSVMSQAAADRRHELGVQVRSSVVLVRETDEVNHGGQPIDELLQAVPEQIGCAEHVLSFDGDCAECTGFAAGVRAALEQHAGGAGPGLGVIDWRRVLAFKLVSLKQIVQAMLLAQEEKGPPASAHQPSVFEVLLRAQNKRAHEDSSAVYVSGEIDSAAYAMPAKAAPLVLMHSACHLSGELQSLLKGAVPGLVVQAIGGDTSGGDSTSTAGGESDIASILNGGRRTSRTRAFSSAMARRPAAATQRVILVVVVHRDCFKDTRVVRSLLLALETKTQIVLVHESDAKNRGCSFEEVIANCPPAAKAARGFNNQKLFEPIAVQWTRGPHQAVSVRILAMALGAQQLTGANAAGAGLPADTASARGPLAAVQAAQAALKGLAARARGRGAAARAESDRPKEGLGLETGWSNFAGPEARYDLSGLATPNMIATVCNPMSVKKEGGVPAVPVPAEGLHL
jgi:hypothetical protein